MKLQCLFKKSAHDDANIIFGAVIDDSMEGQMRVTVIATGFELKTETEQLIQKLPNKNINNFEEESLRMAVGDNSFSHLKSLANEIKEENPETLNSTVNLDIPTFLRKHAD